MSSSADHEEGTTPTASGFATTHWSAVLVAGNSSAPGTQVALEKLCRAYWQPLYAFVRRQGSNPHEAEDLIQEFFSRLIEKKQLRVADPDRGRFRSFLLGTLKHFLSDERKKERAQKRGGGQALISMDADSAEDRCGFEPATDLTPEKIFDQRWALTVLEQAVARLQAEYAASGRAELFEELKHFQPGEKGHSSYAEVAARLGLTESAVKSAIHRLRQRHRDLLRDEIAQTVSSPTEVDEELRYLISVMGG